MSWNFLTDVVQEKQDSAVNEVGLFLRSYVKVMDIMRYNEFEYGIEDVGRLYGMITGNQYWVGRTQDHHRGIKDFRVEMHQFIKQRVIFVVETAIAKIKSLSNPDNHPIGTTAKRSLSNDLTMRELRLMEFDILRKCEHAEAFDPKGSSHSLDESYLADLTSTLERLVMMFDNVVKEVRAPSRDAVRYHMRLRQADDHDSVPVIVLLGHLIGHVALSLLIAKTDPGVVTMSGKVEMEQRLVFDEFTKYSNLGSMSLAGILCCYRQCELLSAAVLNPKGSLGPFEREFMLNILVLGKLTRSKSK